MTISKGIDEHLGAGVASSPALAGLRVLVVEDEMLVSMLIEDLLIDQDCVIVGPFCRVAGALDAAQHQAIDLAVLDVNIAGMKVFPVAELLEQRGIPFLLLSGYGETAVPPDRPYWRSSLKPFKGRELISKLEALVSPR